MTRHAASPLTALNMTAGLVNFDDWSGRWLVSSPAALPNSRQPDIGVIRIHNARRRISLRGPAIVEISAHLVDGR